MTQPKGTDKSIEATLHRAAGGDDAAWGELVETYTRRVYALLVSQCHDRELAEELTQVTFVKLFDQLRRADGYQEYGRFESWLFRVAMNHLRDEMRRRKRQARPMDMSPAAASGRREDAAEWAEQQQHVVQGGPTAIASPIAQLEQAEQVQRLRHAMAQMSEADREVLHLRHTAGLGFNEIAETLDQPLGTVLARAHRAIKKLRQLLTPA